MVENDCAKKVNRGIVLLEFNASLGANADVLYEVQVVKRHEVIQELTLEEKSTMRPHHVMARLLRELAVSHTFGFMAYLVTVACVEISLTAPWAISMPSEQRLAGPHSQSLLLCPTQPPLQDGALLHRQAPHRTGRRCLPRCRVCLPSRISDFHLTAASASSTRALPGIRDCQSSFA